MMRLLKSAQFSSGRSLEKKSFSPDFNSSGVPEKTDYLDLDKSRVLIERFPFLPFLIVHHTVRSSELRKCAVV